MWREGSVMGLGCSMEMRINTLKMLQSVNSSCHAEIVSLADSRCIIHEPMYPAFKVAFWIFVLLLALSFFGISIQAIINSPAGQANFGYLLHVLSQGWQWLTEWIHSTL